MSPIAISADKRFHRAHVKPGRKRGRWKSVAIPALKILLLTAAVVFAAYRGTAILARATSLRVDHIVVHGNGRMSSDEVMTVLGGLRGENIVRTDLDAWRSRLLESPWVRDVAFRRSLPSTVDVLVSEREPIGIGRIDGRLYLVDERGSIIDVYGPRYADLDLPIIDGLSQAPSPEGAGDDRAGLATRVIVALRAKPAVAGRLSQVDVTNPHNAAIIVSGDSALIYVGEDKFLARLESYLGLASSLRERVPDIDYVDLRFDDRIYVRPVGKLAQASVPKLHLDGRPRVARAAATRR